MTPIASNLAGAALSSAVSGTASTADAARAKLTGAAQQFEAIFTRQMLASARKASFGDELFGSGAIDTFRDMQDSQFADLTAKTGSLGLAKQIEAHMSRLLGATGTEPAGSPGTGAGAVQGGKA